MEIEANKDMNERKGKYLIINYSRLKYMPSSTIPELM